MLTLFSAAATHVGLVRTNNEDAYLELPGRGLFALSDGMGVAAAGEVASRYFIETVHSVFVPQAFNPDEADISLVEKTFALSNKLILQHAEQNPDNWGMGCTGDILLFSGSRYIIGHVGDSRIYLSRNRKLQQLTKDHSLVQGWVDEGIITTEDAKRHPRKNILLQAIGTQPILSPDILRGEALDHDVFLLCSDGLTDMMEDDAIQEVLASRELLQNKLDNLINAALRAGGKDNVTAVLCELEMYPAAADEKGASYSNARANGK